MKNLTITGGAYNHSGVSHPGNKLTTLPQSFASLSTLETLNLNTNIIDSLPDNFGNLSNLKTLNLTGQREYLSGSYTYYLKYIPASFANLTGMVTLHMDNNQYIGELDLSQMVELNTLNVSYNLLFGLKLPTPFDNSISSFSITNNSYLSCIEVDSVSLVSYSSTAGYYDYGRRTSIDNGVIFSTDCSNNNIPLSERLALIDLYLQCKAAPAQIWTNWDTNAASYSNAGTWQGVTTDTIDGQKHVVKLILSNQYLKDTIPTSIKNLP